MKLIPILLTLLIEIYVQIWILCPYSCMIVFKVYLFYIGFTSWIEIHLKFAMCLLLIYDLKCFLKLKLFWLLHFAKSDTNLILWENIFFIFIVLIKRRINTIPIMKIIIYQYLYGEIRNAIKLYTFEILKSNNFSIYLTCIFKKYILIFKDVSQVIGMKGYGVLINKPYVIYLKLIKLWKIIAIQNFIFDFFTGN